MVKLCVSGGLENAPLACFWCFLGDFVENKETFCFWKQSVHLNSVGVGQVPLPLNEALTLRLN